MTTRTLTDTDAAILDDIMSKPREVRTYIEGRYADLGAEYVEAVMAQIWESDHPAYGEDWSDWLAEAVPEIVAVCVDALDALR